MNISEIDLKKLDIKTETWWGDLEDKEEMPLPKEEIKEVNEVGQRKIVLED
jgi:hypothetical protein